MTLRVVHLGDLHLQSTHPLNADRQAALVGAIVMAGGGEPVAAWVFPGDLNHARMTIEDRNFLAEQLRIMAAQAPVVICYGNHDAPGDLDVFARLRAPHSIHVVSRPQCLDVGTLRIFALPYPSKASLVAHGLQHESLHGETQKAMDLLFMEAAGQLDAARQDGRPVLMIGHVSVAGAVSSVGQPQIGGELEITQDHLTRLGDCPKLLNHIHKHQFVADAVYAGSLCRLDWGEVEPKGYVVAEYATCPERHWTVRFHEVDIPPMYHVEGKVFAEESGAAFVWSVKRGPDGEVLQPPTSWANCDVRVRVSYPQQERAMLPTITAMARAPFDGARRLEIEPIVIPDRALRAPQVVAAKTLDEKLAAWAALSGVSWAGEIVRCATALQADEDPEAVVAGVRARLAPLADVTSLLADATAAQIQAEVTR